MAFAEKKFKGKTVFVEVDDSGEMMLEKGRASMKYKIDDEKIYQPWPDNIENLDGTKPSKSSKGSTVKKVATPRTKKKTVSPPVGAPPSENTIIAYTDGGCIGNPGPAGLGYVIRYPDGRLVHKGEPLGHGTNNIAELTAIERVLELVEEKDEPLLIHTDSSYSIGVLSMNWKAKANQVLIARIKKKMADFSNLSFRKVKGHAGVPDNELVDDLARNSAETQQTIE